MKLQTIKPRVSLLKSGRRTAVAILRPSRIRGRALQERNRRFLHLHPLCAECQRAGRIAEAREVDHVVALWAGGQDEEHNLQGLCIPCHREKTKREAAVRSAGSLIS